MEKTRQGLYWEPTQTKRSYYWWARLWKQVMQYSATSCALSRANNGLTKCPSLECFLSFLDTTLLCSIVFNTGQLRVHYSRFFKRSIETWEMVARLAEKRKTEQLAQYCTILLSKSLWTDNAWVWCNRKSCGSICDSFTPKLNSVLHSHQTLGL